MGYIRVLGILGLFLSLTVQANSQGMLNALLFESSNSIANPSMIATGLNNRDYSGFTASINRQWFDNRFGLTQSIGTFEHSSKKGVAFLASFRSTRFGGKFSENALTLGSRYRLALKGKSSSLAFGISGFISQSKADFENAKLESVDDPFLSGVLLIEKRLDASFGVSWTWNEMARFSHRLSCFQNSVAALSGPIKYNSYTQAEYCIMRNRLDANASTIQGQKWFLVFKYKEMQRLGGQVDIAFDYCPKNNSCLRFGVEQQLDISGNYFNVSMLKFTYIPMGTFKRNIAGGFSQGLMTSRISTIAKNLGEYFISLRY